MTATPAGSRIDRFNALPEADGARRLATCLAVERWVADVLDGRPYADEEALYDAASISAAGLTPDEVEAALSRHPRIGERAGHGHDAAFSAAEQAGVDGTGTAVAAALAEGNRAYEERFGRVFLIRAAGRSADEILSLLRRRLDNTDEAELAEVRTQLGEIAMLRLREVVAR